MYSANETYCGSLTEITRSLWKPLIPNLDEISLKILRFYAEEPGKELSLYKASKETGLNIATVYKRGRILASMRLLEYLDKYFRANSKTCLALYAYEMMGPRRLYECLQSIWGFSGVSEHELLSFLALLAYSISLRGLNIANANICLLDEASLHVIRLYRLISVLGLRPKKLVCRGVGGEDKEFTPIGLFSKIIGLPKDIVIPAIRFALRGINDLLPPTIVTERHKVWLRITNGGYRILLVECKSSCRHYDEDLGLSCPLVIGEVENVFRRQLLERG